MVLASGAGMVTTRHHEGLDRAAFVEAILLSKLSTRNGYLFGNLSIMRCVCVTGSFFRVGRFHHASLMTRLPTVSAGEIPATDQLSPATHTLSGHPPFHDTPTLQTRQPVAQGAPAPRLAFAHKQPPSARGKSPAFNRAFTTLRLD